LEKVCSLLKETISFSEREIHSEAKESFLKRLKYILGSDDFKKKLENIPDLNFCYSPDFQEKYNLVNIASEELSYRKWFAQNCLALNTLNDFDYSVNQAYDPIHLPNMLAPVDELYP